MRLVVVLLRTTLQGLPTNISILPLPCHIRFEELHGHDKTSGVLRAGQRAGPGANILGLDPDLDFEKTEEEEKEHDGQDPLQLLFSKQLLHPTTDCSTDKATDNNG